MIERIISLKENFVPGTYHTVSLILMHGKEKKISESQGYWIIF